MELPSNKDIFETKTGYIWQDENGIICSITKKDAPRLSNEENEEETKLFLEKYGNKKQLFLFDIKHAQPNTPEERKRAAAVLNEITTAMALIVHNALGRMMVNLFVGLQKPPYPLKIFKPEDEQKAINWLLSQEK